MSVTVLRRVIENSSATGGARLLLLVLAEHADDNGKCWPSVGTLARECRCSKRYVTANLRALESSGDITTEQKTGNRSTYFVTTKVLNDSSPLKNGSVLNDSSQPMNHSSATPELSFTQTVKNRNEPSNPPIVPPMENDDGTDGNETDSLDAGPGEAKPEADDPPKPEPKRKRAATAKCGLDGNWEPDHGAIAYAEERGLDWQRTWEDFRDYNIKHGKQWAGAKGWNAAWQGWCRRQNEFDAKQNSRNGGNGRQPRAGSAGQGDRPNDPWHEAILARRAAGVGQFGEAIPAAGNGQPDGDGCEVLLFGDWKGASGS